jgi:hypothetical protein
MQSDQARQLKMTQAANLGVYNPQSGLSYVTKLEILDALNSGYLKDTLDPMERASHDQIQSENQDIINKLDVEVNDWDNHEQHIFEHSLFRMSSQVRNLKRKDPALYEYVIYTLENHIKEHSKYVQNKKSQNTYQDAKAFLK